MTTKFLSLLLIICISGCKPKTKETINYNSPTPKIYIDWYDNGNIKKLQTWKDGKINGKCYSWYLNGRTKEMYTYKNDILNGKYITWYENGKKQTEGYYYNKYLAGRCLHWHENGNLEELLLSDDGTKTISIKLFSKDGKLLAQCLYKKNKPWNGTLIENGKILSIQYKNGKKSQKSQSYSEPPPTVLTL
jgi:antitoxin component YwqK of YwqJK toxin-antitoxin module